MAWNEPGGNNNDPWKNRGGRDQGPPDLDEVFKNILNKFGKFGPSLIACYPLTCKRYVHCPLLALC